ncbi:MAG: hypothetical protein IJS96_01910 [Schwartzia sp.]|nr:hypothetical protein [Schwartzia sp. (in: firmicutes)]
MAIVRKFIRADKPLTPEQLEKLNALENRPIVFDEDCPELTDEQLDKIAAMARKRDAEEARAKELHLQPLPLNVLPSTIRAAEKYGAAVMGRLLDLAVQDEAMIKKCL